MHLKYCKSAILQLKKKNSDIWISIGNILWNPYNLSYFILWTIINCKLVFQNFSVVSSFPLHRVQWLCAWALILCFHLVVTEKMNWSEVQSLSRVRLFAIPWTVAYQDPPSVGFSRQEYWRGLPFPSPGDLSDQGIEPRSPALQAAALTSEPPRKSRYFNAIKIVHNTCT